MANDPDISDEYLRAMFSYDPDTGKFARKQAYGKQPAGSEPGSITPQGYRYIGLVSRSIPAHRLAWRYMYGVWPTGHVDHINHVRDDNRIANLRDVSMSANLRSAQRPSPYPNQAPKWDGYWAEKKRQKAKNTPS